MIRAVMRLFGCVRYRVEWSTPDPRWVDDGTSTFFPRREFGWADVWARNAETATRKAWFRAPPGARYEGLTRC